MTFLQFVFSFLYTRNWHTGKKELSRPRVALFVGGVSLVTIALAIIGLLHVPAVYLP